MHYAVRLRIDCDFDGTKALDSSAVFKRETVVDIATKKPFGLLDLGPIQTQPADKPLYLQSIGVDLGGEGGEGCRIEAFDPKGGPSFVLLDLHGVTSRFDSKGWLLPVGYQIRITGPTTARQHAHVIRFDFWQLDNVNQVLTKNQSSGNAAAIPVGPAGGDLTGIYPNPYVSALRSGQESLSIRDVRVGEMLVRSGTTITSQKVPSFDGSTASGDLTGSYPGPQVLAITANGTKLSFDQIRENQLLQRVGSRITGIDAPSRGSVYGLNYKAEQQAIDHAPTTGTAYVDVVSMEVPAVPQEQRFRLDWFAEVLIRTNTEWGLRLFNKTNSSVMSPIDPQAPEYRVRNAMEGFQAPHCGSLLIGPNRGAFSCALQVRSPTGGSVIARNGLLQFFRVS